MNSAVASAAKIALRTKKVTVLEVGREGGKQVARVEALEVGVGELGGYLLAHVEKRAVVDGAARMCDLQDAALEAVVVALHVGQGLDVLGVAHLGAAHEVLGKNGLVGVVLVALGGGDVLTVGVVLPETDEIARLIGKVELDLGGLLELLDHGHEVDALFLVA